MVGMNGVNAYQQASQVWNQSNKSTESDTRLGTSKTTSKTTSSKNGSTGSATELKNDTGIKTSTWKPIDTKSSLVPTQREGIGMAIGNVELSDKAKDYYSKLKAKFGNMEFIAVSKDMKDAVKANAAAYGNANKMVVLIDDAKIEQMANDEAFRKKYEGIIAMSQNQLASAKNSLASSGASVKNFGMSVNSDGTTSFFATLENSSKQQTKRIEKQQAKKKEEKAKAKKHEEKVAKEKRLEKLKEKNKAEDIKEADKDNALEQGKDKEYVKIEAGSIDELVNKLSDYAYVQSENMVMTNAEKNVGQHFDFKG